MTYYDYLSTPIGLVHIYASERGITQVNFSDELPTSPSCQKNALVETCKQQLQAYFAKQAKHFDLPLDTSGTDFQERVWYALGQIGYGKTCSYTDLALKLGQAKAVRALGAASGKNPLALILPCHRVIGRDGSLTGYAWGLERKRWLLCHEAMP